MKNICPTPIGSYRSQFRKGPVMKYFSIILSVVLLFICTGCSSKTQSVALSDFKKQDTGFSFGSLAWGASVEDVEKTLNVSLEKAEEGVSTQAMQTHGYFLYDRTLENTKGNLFFEFSDSGLFSVEFQSTGEEQATKKFFSDTIEKIKKSWGEETERSAKSNEEVQMNWEGYRWYDENSNTAFIASLAYGENVKTTAVFCVANLSASPAP